MTTIRPFALGATLVFAVASTACSKGPAAPFDTLPDAQVTAFKLQNYEPPAPAPGQPAAQPGTLALPPELQALVQAGAQGLQQVIPPGLIPPGLIPGLGGPTPAPAPQNQDTAPRFPMQAPNFRILGQAQVADPELREELAEIFGDEDNFHNQHSSCMYAEMGLAWGGAPGANNELLISFSCNQVQARGFMWPHGAVGMKKDTVGKLSELVSKIFPG